MLDLFRNLLKRDHGTADNRKIARMYAYDGKLFVCRIRWIAEVDLPTVLTEQVDDETLGTAILAQLDAFDPGEFDIRSRKKSDWPAYKVSGASSIKAFESKAWICHLSLESWSFEVSASPCLSLKDGLEVRTTLHAPSPESAAKAVRDTLEGARAMGARGAI